MTKENDQLARDILSEITVFMKYAKYLPDEERRETWDELVDRNMNMHIEKFPHLAEEIKEVYDRFVRTKKVLPSMRSMQFAGKAMELNHARGYNCFGRETAFITDSGTKTFYDFADGDMVRVMSHKGVWRDAVVRNYGQQELHTLTFGRGRSKKQIRATRNHRWIRPTGEETTSLAIGDTLAAVTWFSDFEYENSDPLERLYWAYGFVYGDGTKVKSRDGGYTHSMVRLCGEDTKYLPRFEELGFSSTSNTSLKGDAMVFTGTYLKTLPELGKDSPELIRAFVRGYLDADGAKTHNATTKSEFLSIQSSNPESIEFLRSALEVAGVFILGEDDYTGQETNFGVRPVTKRIRVTTHIGNTNSAWSLREISRGTEYEDVWCLEVEEDASFVLSGGLVTGNCSYLPVKDIEAFSETMFLLLSGTGVGYSVQRHHVEQLPTIKKPEKTRRFLIDDSITGWADAVKVLMRAYLDPTKTTRPVFDFRDIRKKGARLVTSGGKAPGPEPLRICLTKIEALLSEKRTGEKLTTLEAHDIQCHIADAVLSGGIRRAAMIALFSYGDNAMASCKSGAWYELNPQRGRANNSAVLLRHRMDRKSFNEVWEYMRASGAGEPGFFFTNDKEVGTNPSLRAGTKVLTDSGIVPIESLQDKTFKVKNLHGQWSDARCWLSGKGKQLYKITLSNGYEIFATPEHKWAVKSGSGWKKVETSDLKEGAVFPTLRNSRLHEGSLGDNDDGFVVGWLYGDGWVTTRQDTGVTQYGMVVSKADGEEIRDKISRILLEKTGREVTFTDRGSTWEFNVQAQAFHDYFSKFGVEHKSQGLPTKIWTECSHDFIVGFVDGLLSSDGSVETSAKRRLMISSSKEKLVREFGELLSFFGITSTIRESKISGRNARFPNGKTYDRDYTSYRLRVSKRDSFTHFLHVFSLTNREKQARLEGWADDYVPHLNGEIKVTSMELTELHEDVWDITVYDNTHCFQIPYCITGNCAEISLKPFGFCNLTEINAASIIDQDDYNGRARAAAFIGTIQAAYTDFYYLRDEWKETAEKEALLGVSMTGIASGTVTNLNMEEAANIAVEENIRVAALLGINKARRVTTVKPSGTTSLVLGSSSGVHAWHNDYYLRRIRVNKNEAIYAYLMVYHPELVEDEFFSPDTTAVITIPQKAPSGATTRHNETAVSLLQRVKLLHDQWIKPGHVLGDNTHNVSCTINIKDDEWDEVRDFLWKHKDSFTAVSCLPHSDHSYQQAPFEDCTRYTYEKLVKTLSRVDLTKVIEPEDNTSLADNLACYGGACLIE